MDGNLNVKVADFGFAREVDSSNAKLNLTFCGSEFFEAPEIMFCMDYDERIDIFSYGMVLCEVISRKHPSVSTFKRMVPGFGVDSEEIRSLANPGCPENLLRLACECCYDEPDRRPELVMAVSELKVAYNELTEKEYIDEKDPEQTKLEQQREIMRLLDEADLLEEMEKEQRLADQQGKEFEVQATAVLSLSSKTIKVKRESTVKINPVEFKRSSGAGAPSTKSSVSPPKEVSGLALPKKERRLSFGKKNPSAPVLDPEIIRIGRHLLQDKYTQARKEDQERWNKFLVGFTMAIPVSDKQIRALGRIRTYKKWYFGTQFT